MNPVPGQNFGAGFGFGMGNWGRGCRNWFRATGLPGWMRGGWGGVAPGPTAFAPETEKQMLEQEAEGLQSELNRIKKRLSEISTAKQEEEK
jgi:hypothetical protein